MCQQTAIRDVHRFINKIIGDKWGSNEEHCLWCQTTFVSFQDPPTICRVFGSLNLHVSIPNLNSDDSNNIQFNKAVVSKIIGGKVLNTLNALTAILVIHCETNKKKMISKIAEVRDKNQS